MRVRMRTLMASAAYVLRPGFDYDVEDSLGRLLVESRYAEELQPVLEEPVNSGLEDEQVFEQEGNQLEDASFADVTEEEQGVASPTRRRSRRG